MFGMGEFEDAAAPGGFQVLAFAAEHMAEEPGAPGMLPATAVQVLHMDVQADRQTGACEPFAQAIEGGPPLESLEKVKGQGSAIHNTYLYCINTKYV